MNSRSLPQKILSLLAYLGLSLVLAFLLVSKHTEVLKIGDLAPIQDQLVPISGPVTTFNRLLKNPMLVNFWATWCPPCQKELPMLTKLAKKYQGKIAFVGAAIDSPKADILELKKEHSLNYLLAQIDSETLSRWQANALPTTYIIDKRGRILWAKAGLAHEEELDSALALALKK